MIFTVIASGSKGNVTYIASSTTQILIDVGISCVSLEKQLADIEVNPRKIDGILITHTHSDHVNGLKTFIRKYNSKIYLTSKMYNELVDNVNLINYEIIGNNFSIKDININAIKLSHDSDESVGYILESNEKTLVYITDTGYINNKYHSKLMNKDAYIIESNHDVKMLMNGKYPYHIKQRILGDKGHLSNNDSSKYITKFIGDKTKKVVLIHLSEDNNTPEIAHETLQKSLRENNIKFNDIVISSQKERTEIIKI